jgi:hypothetical protein
MDLYKHQEWNFSIVLRINQLLIAYESPHESNALGLINMETQPQVLFHPPKWAEGFRLVYITDDRQV